MHTETRIGVSVGLRDCKCMQLGMHTDCIQSAYKHIKEEKRGFFLLLLLYIVCSSIFYCSRFQAFIFYCSRFRHSRTPSSFIACSFRSGCFHVRWSWRTASPCDLYALYASKNRLCTLCENTTPKKTAYNAYRNANRRVRRAEGTKMYAVGDAYKVHTECIQAYKRVKERNFSPTSSLYCLFLYLLLSAISGNHLFFIARTFGHSSTNHE